MAQRVGRGIALLLHYHGTKRGLVVSSTPWPHFTPGKDPVPFVQEAGWAPGPVWRGGKGIRSPDRPARSKSLYRLCYAAHTQLYVRNKAFDTTDIKVSETIAKLQFNPLTLEIDI